MFLAIRDLRRGVRRFALLGAVIALVAVLSTVLSGLATGLVTDGISGLRALPLDRIVLQEGFVILPAVENTDDGYRVVFDGKRDDGSFAVVGSAKAESHIIAFCSTKRKKSKALAVTHDGLRVSCRDAR